MSDLIDRQAALDAIDSWRREYPIDLQEPIDDCWNSIRELPAAQPDHNADIGKKAEGDCISRQAAIDAMKDALDPHIVQFVKAKMAIEALPSAQPELTDEQSIAHLQSSGWMQRHDKEMYESGLKEQLADDSDSYDSLLPAVHPEVIRCKNCEHWKNEHLCKSLSRFGSFETKADFYCGMQKGRLMRELVDKRLMLEDVKSWVAMDSYEQHLINNMSEWIENLPTVEVSDGDCISRRVAIDALKGLPTWWADEGGYYGGAQPPMVALLDPEDAVSAIENLPSAQPQSITCDGCKHVGTYDTDFPCSSCIRREKDYYEPDE